MIGLAIIKIQLVGGLEIGDKQLGFIDSGLKHFGG